MESLRFGIIGVGGIGSAHFNCVSSGKIEGMTLAAVCDIDPKRLDYCRNIRPDVPSFIDYRELISSGIVDAVIVAVPHRLHAQIASECLEAGIHTITEKPEDITVKRAKFLNSVAEKSGRVFGIMFNQRTNPLFQRARELVKSGELGEIKRSVWIITNWYRSQYYYDSGDWRATWAGEGGGILMNQAPHNLDLWQWICGMPSEITAFCDTAKWHNIEVEDDVTIFARYPNGATGVFITSTGEYPGTNRLEITGTKGTVIIEHGKLTFKRLEDDEGVILRTAKTSNPQIQYETEIYAPVDSGSAHSGILQNFANAVRFSEPLIAPGVEGINALSIANAAILSSWTKSSVSLPLDDDTEELYERLLSEKQKASSFKEGGEKQTHETYSPRWQVTF